MSDETRRVLDMLAQGKITVDEADRLMAAIKSAGRTATETATAEEGPAAGDAKSPKYLRITVTKAKGWRGDDEAQGRRAWMGSGKMNGNDREVSIRVPLTLIRNGIRLGAMIPGLAGSDLQAHLRECGVDVNLSKIDAETIDRLVDEFGEVNIDVVSGRGSKAQVRITCE